MDLAERQRALRSLATAIERRRPELEDAIVRTSRKTRRVAAGEIDLALRRLRAFERLGPALADRLPVGCVAILFPRNASISNPVGTIGAAVIGGNRVVARFPSASSGWTAHFAPLVTAHLPGVRFADGSGRRFLEGALGDPDVAVAMAFGDDAWASSYEPLARSTGTRFIFEGPGKDPFLVLEGADVERAAQDAVRGGYYNAGQACTSPERFYVHHSLWDAFVGRVIELTRAQVVGDPDDPAVTVGPVASERAVARILAQLDEAVRLGARVVAGGRAWSAPLRDGTRATYVMPTVVVGARREMSLMRDETFGPVIAIQRVATDAEAVALASDCRYGLAASVFAPDARAAAPLEASHGLVFHNEIWLDRFERDPLAPYGGRRRSGWVWEWDHGRFVRRDGPRHNVREFTRPAASERRGA